MRWDRQSRLTRRQLLVTAGLAIGAASFGVQADLPKPFGRVVLTLRGAVTQTNFPQEARFDMLMLEALRQVSHTVELPWYPRPVTLTGPLLRDVLATVGAQGQLIEAVALNDYAVTFPLSDAQRYDVILARLLDGRPMSPRDKGPLFVIFPYDQLPPEQVELYYERSIWQLDTLVIR